MAGAKAARDWLEKQNVDSPTISHVCQIIFDLAFKGAKVKTAMKTIEGKCVQDSDRLDAMGAIGIARVFTLGGHWGRPIHVSGQKPILHSSSKSYRKHQMGTNRSTLNHFYEKLFLLKSRLNTQTAKKIGQERDAFMRHFVKQFLAEWDGKDAA